MAKFCVPLNPAGDPILQLSTALAGRKLLVKQGPDITDPMRALAIKGREFASALNSFTEALRLVDADQNLKNDKLLIKLFEDLVYSSTELMDVYAIDLCRSLDLKNSKELKIRLNEYNIAVKDARRDWGLICNKLKHNHNVLAPVSQSYKPSGIRIFGYALCRPVGTDSISLNQELHKKGERSRSYNRSLPQLIYDVFRCDARASYLINSLPDDDSAPLPDIEIPLAIGAQLENIKIRSQWVGGGEAQTFDGFTLLPTAICFEKSRGSSIHEDATFSIEYVADGITRNFMIP